MMFYADNFPDFVEMLAEEETDGKNTNEECNNNNESSDDNSNQHLYLGCRLSLGISMLLVVMFCVGYALSGIALADFLPLIELHCLLPNQCAKSTKLLCDFFQEIEESSGTSLLLFILPGILWNTETKVLFKCSLPVQL